MIEVNDHAWDPDQYERFANDRARPANDLMARIPLRSAETVIDLGCGTGHQAAQLSERFPEAQVLGLDSSAEMLGQAVSAYGTTDLLQWQQADIASFEPDTSVDLIFSNAALHWVPDHATLFPNMISWLKPGGVLAVQMPNNFDAPSHEVRATVARSGPWASRFGGMTEQPTALNPADYYTYLSPVAAHVDIWETTYLHVFNGEDPVAEWTRSTALRPYLAALENDEERAAFFEAYALRLRGAYPPCPDGKTLFPFRRLFVVATV